MLMIFNCWCLDQFFSSSTSAPPYNTPDCEILDILQQMENELQ